MAVDFITSKIWASLVIQLVKNLPAMQETRVDPWVTKIPSRREQLPTPVFLPGEFHGQRSLEGYSPWSRKESDMTERLSLSVEGGRKSNILSYYALLFQERASLMAQMVTNLPAVREAWVQSLGWEDPLEKGIATPVFLPGEFHGQRSLEGYSPRGHKESDMTEHTQMSPTYSMLFLLIPGEGSYSMQLNVDD